MSNASRWGSGVAARQVTVARINKFCAALVLLFAKAHLFGGSELLGELRGVIWQGLFTLKTQPRQLNNPSWCPCKICAWGTWRNSVWNGCSTYLLLGLWRTVVWLPFALLVFLTFLFLCSLLFPCFPPLSLLLSLFIRLFALLFFLVRLSPLLLLLLHSFVFSPSPLFFFYYYNCLLELFALLLLLPLLLLLLIIIVIIIINIIIALPFPFL